MDRRNRQAFGPGAAPVSHSLLNYRPSEKVRPKGPVSESRCCRMDPEGMGARCPRPDCIKVEEMLPQGGGLAGAWRAGEVPKPGGALAP